MQFNKKSLRKQLPDAIGYANINVDPAGVVEGVLYDIVDEHRTRLDQSERYPDHYGRIMVEVESDETTRECSAYQAQPDKIASGLVPSREYLDHILAARDLLSEQYLESLEKSRTYISHCAFCQVPGEVFFLQELDRIHALCPPCHEARLASQRLPAPPT